MTNQVNIEIPTAMLRTIKNPTLTFIECSDTLLFRWRNTNPRMILANTAPRRIAITGMD
jgi:hypothetical protein